MRSRNRPTASSTYTQDDLLDYALITQPHLQEGGMTTDALCAAAVTYSDTTAANLLLRSVGGPAALTAYLRSLGDTITRLDRMEPELNSALTGDVRDTTTLASMLQMQRIILLGEALSASLRRQLLDWLIANTTGDAKLRAGIPAGVSVTRPAVAHMAQATTSPSHGPRIASLRC